MPSIPPPLPSAGGAQDGGPVRPPLHKYGTGGWAGGGWAGRQRQVRSWLQQPQLLSDLLRWRAASRRPRT